MNVFIVLIVFEASADHQMIQSSVEIMGYIWLFIFKRLLGKVPTNHPFYVYKVGNVLIKGFCLYFCWCINSLLDNFTEMNKAWLHKESIKVSL